MTFMWSGTQCIAALEKTRSAEGSRHAAMSATRNDNPGRRAWAEAIIDSELSTP